MRFGTRRAATNEVMARLQFYNHRSLHSTLGNLHPMNFETADVNERKRLGEEEGKAAYSTGQGRRQARVNSRSRRSDDIEGLGFDMQLEPSGRANLTTSRKNVPLICINIKWNL